MDQEVDISLETKRWFRIYTTLLQIAEKRGFFVPADQKFDSIRQFNQKKSSVEKLLFYKEEEDEANKALGIHCNFFQHQIQEGLISKFIQNYKTTNFDTIIFVANKSKKPMSAEYDKLFNLKFSQQLSIRIQIFKQEDLEFNVLKHDLVPEHQILKEEEKANILAYYKVKQSQLPKILVTDPAARFLGLRKGQVVKISRKSQTAGRYTTYRIAV